MATIVDGRSPQGKRKPGIGSAIGWINRWPVAGALRGYKEYDAYWLGASKAAEKFGYRLPEGTSSILEGEPVDQSKRAAISVRASAAL